MQWFWGTVVREGVTRQQAEERMPQRPAGRDELAAFFTRVSRDLSQALRRGGAGHPRLDLVG